MSRYFCPITFQITLLFLQHMNLLLSKTPQNDIRNHVLPMVYRALESGTPQIQVNKRPLPVHVYSRISVSRLLTFSNFDTWFCVSRINALTIRCTSFCRKFMQLSENIKFVGWIWYYARFVFNIFLAPSNNMANSKSECMPGYICSHVIQLRTGLSEVKMSYNVVFCFVLTI